MQPATHIFWWFTELLYDWWQGRFPSKSIALHGGIRRFGGYSHGTAQLASQLAHLCQAGLDEQATYNPHLWIHLIIRTNLEPDTYPWNDKQPEILFLCIPPFACFQKRPLNLVLHLKLTDTFCIRLGFYCFWSSAFASGEPCIAFFCITAQPFLDHPVLNTGFLNQFHDGCAIFIVKLYPTEFIWFRIITYRADPVLSVLTVSLQEIAQVGFADDVFSANFSQCPMLLCMLLNNCYLFFVGIGWSVLHLQHILACILLQGVLFFTVYFLGIISISGFLWINELYFLTSGEFMGHLQK